MVLAIKITLLNWYIMLFSQRIKISNSVISPLLLCCKLRPESKSRYPAFYWHMNVSENSNDDSPSKRRRADTSINSSPFSQDNSIPKTLRLEIHISLHYLFMVEALLTKDINKVTADFVLKIICYMTRFMTNCNAKSSIVIIYTD